jgi:hypothetical protein
MNVENNGSNINLLKKIEEKRLHILSFIESEDWEGLRKDLEASLYDYYSSELVASALLLGQSQQLRDGEVLVGGRNALHVACSLGAPISIIRTIRQMCPPCMEGVDENGCTPLHVAAESGASPQVIDCLLYWYPEASSLKDCRGKTPLHLLFSSPNIESSNCPRLAEESQQPQPGQTKVLLWEPKKSTTTSTIQIIQSLIKAAPQSVNEEDDCGLNPLEYAINSNASINVIRTLQRASVVAWNEMDRHKANQEILKKRLQAAVRQTEQASRRRLTSTASTITDANKTITTISRAQMLMDQLLPRTATTNGTSHDNKRTKHDRRKNWIENGFLSETSVEKNLTCSRETLKSSASKAA